MWDWAEAIIAAACIVAFVIFGTYMIAWSAPVARPVDAITNGGNVHYRWDESILNWVAP
jgi:hypothetical protein